MFLKSFLVLGCLVLFTSSNPTWEVNDIRSFIDQLKICLNSTLKENNCSDIAVPKINFTVKKYLYERHQSKFCEISEALYASKCVNPNIEKLQRLSHHMKGNVTCTLQDNGSQESMQCFLKHLESYVLSLEKQIPKN